MNAIIIDREEVKAIMDINTVYDFLDHCTHGMTVMHPMLRTPKGHHSEYFRELQDLRVDASAHGYKSIAHENIRMLSVEPMVAISNNGLVFVGA